MSSIQNKVIFKGDYLMKQSFKEWVSERERALIASLTIWEITFRRGNKLDNILKFDHVILQERRRKEKKIRRRIRAGFTFCWFFMKNIFQNSYENFSLRPTANEDGRFRTLESTTKCTREFFINCFIFHGFILFLFSSFFLFPFQKKKM